MNGSASCDGRRPLLRSAAVKWIGALVLCMMLLPGVEAEAKRRRRKPAPRPAAPEGRAEAPPSGDPAADEAPARKQRVVVLELASLGIAGDEIESLGRYLRHSIGTIDTVEMVSPVDVQIALSKPKNKEVAACGGGPKCALQVGALVQADVVVFGSVGAMGDAFSLNLRALDVATGVEKARQTTSLSGTRHQLIPEMRLAAFRLIAPDRIRGSLLIEIDVEGVEIEIDGLVVGVSPMQGEVKNLTPGSHVVVLRRPGYSEFQQEFEIKPFDTARLKLDLKKAQKEAN